MFYGNPKEELADVQILCHVGELSNPYEKESLRESVIKNTPGCVLTASESIGTRLNTICWRKRINKDLAEHKQLARVVAPRANCFPSVTCPKGSNVAWAHDEGDYAWVNKQLVPQWLQQQSETGERKLHVIVSHGALIQSTFFPSPTRANFPDMLNTGIVFKRYYGNVDRDGTFSVDSEKTASEVPIDYGDNTPHVSMTDWELKVVEELSWKEGSESDLDMAELHSELSTPRGGVESASCTWTGPKRECLYNAQKRTADRVEADKAAGTRFT